MKTKQDLHWALVLVFAFISFISGIQNEESALWWIPCAVFGLGALYFLKKVASGGGGQD